MNINQNFFDPNNKKVIGKMKDEYKGKPISEFIGKKSKINCIHYMVKNLIQQKE